MAGEAELVLGVLCGGLVVLVVVTTYWFYTIPARYRTNRLKLARFMEK